MIRSLVSYVRHGKMASQLCMNRHQEDYRSQTLVVLVAAQTILCNFLFRNKPEFREPPIALLPFASEVSRNAFCQLEHYKPSIFRGLAFAEGFLLQSCVLVLCSFSAETLLFEGLYP